MKNLVEQASNLLQSEACRSGNIVERTNTVVSAFRSYILEEKKEVCEKTGLSLSSITNKIESHQKSYSEAISIVKKYYRYPLKIEAGSTFSGHH